MKSIYNYTYITPEEKAKHEILVKKVRAKTTLMMRLECDKLRAEFLR